MVTCKIILRALGVHWKSLFIIVYPLLILPIFLVENTAAMRCVYVVVLMAGYWVFEVLPLAVTAMIPLVLFPTMGILDAKKTSLAYFKEANMMFVGGLIIALAIEFCSLHTRISLHAIKWIGCSYRRLNFGLITLTMLVSMWISNTAATAMMIPIIQAVLEELESQGVGSRWEPDPPDIPPEEVDPLSRRPTSVAMCFYISTAYAASIGGLGCIVGSGTNLVLKGIYESEFPHSPGVEFNKWLAANIPLMLAIMYPSWVWMQIWFMGLCRPNSADAKAINVGAEGEEITRKVLIQKLVELGPLSPHEIMVGIMFITAAMLWFFRRPGFISGWPSLLTETQVGDSTAAMIVVLLLFMFPAKMDFRYMFSEDEERRPKAASSGLITWRFVNQKMHWSLIFLMGGGFALADGIKNSGMGDLTAEKLSVIVDLPPVQILIICSLLAMVVTQFTSNAAVANILLPIIANIARKAKIHPMYLMMPVCLSCSFSYCLPVSTPPNAIAAAPCNMRSWEMIKVASVMQVIAILMLIAIFPSLGTVIWDFSEYPDWAVAKNKTKS
ncbi:hypothetical protein Zmor_018041 [Zophobas morio]|uniref:Protein I'm not dead yet n=1 Tax=Zophobas morio TaxID=2755281 RepID=A0AA38MCR2_9CUCU|nr:hypothetical protein Zmor_018041 [Zophobas morio]